MNSNSPTVRELDRKLNKARQILAFDHSVIVVIDPLKWDEEWERFRAAVGLSSVAVQLNQDRFHIVAECIGEISHKHHFRRGARIRCNKHPFVGVELWEFSWTSTRFPGVELYIKFGFKNDKLCMLSFHPDEPERSAK